MRAYSLLFLRFSIALLVFHWGLDKILDPGHTLAVSDRFYMGLLSFPALIPILGVMQVGVALAAMVGFARRLVDPVILLLTLGTALGVWKSILDPWGLVFEGTNALFFPSLIVVAACVLLLAFRSDERYVFDRIREEGKEAPAAG